MNSSNEIAAGLLRILRQVAWLRLALGVLGVALYAILFPDTGARSLLIAFASERALLVGVVSWERARQKLGAVFMPLTIAWLLVTPAIEIVASILSRNEILRAIGSQTDALGISSPLIWLVVPVVIAAWQYGRRGLQIATIALIIEHIALGFALSGSVQLEAAFVLNSAGRIAMLVILGYVVMLLVEAQKKDHAALEQANRQLAQRAATATQLAESRERNRMARELHDILAHSLTALSLQVQAASTMIDHDLAAAKQELREAHLTTRASATEVRRAIQALRATPLEDLGLAQALRELCRAQAERTGVQLDCAVSDIAALDPLTEQAVYRIATEALTNIERHAGAKQVRLNLSLENRKLRLAIQDDGIGFDPRIIPEDHFGVTGMGERAREAGGALKVQSELGKGTTLELEIPV